MIKTEIEKNIYRNELAIQKGTIRDCSPNNGILVSIDENTPLISCTFLKTSKQEKPDFQKGDRVMLTLPEYPGDKGCIIGIIEQYSLDITDKSTKNLLSPKFPLTQEKVIKVDEQVIHINAKKGIKIQCGKGSITFTEDGAIKIEGTSLINRSKGSNKIKGSSVKIN